MFSMTRGTLLPGFPLNLNPESCGISKLELKQGYMSTSEVATAAADILEGLCVVAVNELLLRKHSHFTRVDCVDAFRDSAQRNCHVSGSWQYPDMRGTLVDACTFVNTIRL